MAAPIENMRSSVRIRIKLDTDKKSIRTASRKYWILVQECPTLSTISDLQVQIIDRFHLENNSIKLCLEHFLLPSWESVRILRENDLLSVQNNDAIKHEAYGQLAPKLRVQMEEKQPNSQSCTDEQTTRKKKKKKRKRHHSDSDDNVMDFQEEEVIQPDVIQTVAEQLEQCLVDAEFKQEDPHAEGPVMKKNGVMAVPVDQQHQCLGVTNGNVEINDNVGDNTMVKTKKKRRRRHKPRKSPMDAPTDLNPVCDTKQNLPAPPAMIRRPVKLLPAEKGHVHFDSDKSEDEARLVSDAFSTDSHGIVDNKKAVAAMDVQHADTESSQMLAPSTCAPQRSDSQRNGAVSVREGGQHSNGDGNVKVFYRQKQSSEALTATTQKLESLPNVAVKEKDYSVYDLLHGPPRPGDRIAYKLLELSETYNPEVSSYKEAQVISYDPTTQTLDVKLDTAVVERKPGKFDLMLNDDNETNTEENIFQVSLSWPSLIEPRLLT